MLMLSDIVVVENLSKRYRKEKSREYITALKSVSFKVKRGEIFAIMGPNGAGKTTMLKILSCVIRPDSGDAWVYGYHIIRDRAKAKSASNLIIGGSWIGLHYAYTVRRNLIFFGKLFGLPDNVIGERIKEAIELLDLKDIIDKEAIFLSTGERHRAILAKMLLIRTPVLFLDEPTRSLDPVLANKVRFLLSNLISKEYGITVVMTSHQAVEVETIADRVALLNKGRIIACDTPENLRRRINKLEKLVVRIKGNLRIKPQDVGAEDVKYSEDSIEIICRDSESVIPKLLSLAKANGARVVGIRVERPSLEDVFKELVGGSHGINE